MTFHCSTRKMLPAGLACLSLAVGAAPLRLYVSPTGSDTATGRSPTQALATLARARDAAHALRQAQAAPDGITILLAPGTYVLREPVAFSAADAGTTQAPLVIRGAGPGKSILAGGPVVGGFTRYRGAIQEVDLKSAGLGDKPVRQVLYRGRRLPLARTPNVDPGDIHGGAWAHALGGAGDGPRTLLRYGSDIDPARWHHPTQGTVGIFCKFDWRWNLLPLRGVDLQRKVLRLGRKATYPIQPGDRYFVEGLFEELDAPGEWYFDAEKKILYVWPPQPDRNLHVTVGVAAGLVTLTDTRNITLRDLGFEGGTGNAVTMTNCERCSVEASRIDSPDGWGVTISGGSQCTVEGCDIAWTGHGGISLGGGDRTTLTPAHNQAINNVIHHVGQIERTYNTGINITGVGNRAAHNLIYDTPHAGMTLAGNNNIIELNDVHHTNLQSTDTGGIYSCPRDWTQRGNIIRYNIWHDIGGYGKESSWQPVNGGVVTFVYPHFTWGIYMDDPTSGNIIFGNILYRVPMCAMHNHGGRDNVFENNIIVDCTALNAGALAAGWSEWPHILQRLHAVSHPGSPYLQQYPVLRHYTDRHPEAMTGMRFVHNIVYYTKAGTKWFRQQQKWGDIERLYQLRMRNADFSKDLFDYNLIHVPAGLQLRVSLSRIPGRNRDLTWDQWRATGADAHSQLGDPKFVDPQHLDFHLAPDSPAWKLGFKPIPIDKIGPYKDPLRASWPILVAADARGPAKPVRQEFRLFPRPPARPFTLRGGIPHTRALLKAGKPVRIAYFGGGIHPPDGWRKQLFDWLGKQAPASKITEIDAGITDAVRGSAFSVYRYRHDVLDRKPDLVLVDYTSDDYHTAYPAIQRTIEGIVRQTRERNPAIDLLFVYAFRQGFGPDYAKGICPSAVAAYESVADHYDIASINMGYAIAKAVEAGTMIVRGKPPKGKSAFSADGVRPTPAGNAVYAAALEKGFASLLAVPGTPAPAKLPPPLLADNLQDARELVITPEMLSGKWTRQTSGPDWNRSKRYFDALWVTHTPGASLHFTFTGTAASLFRLVGPDTGKVKITVDGKVVGVGAHIDRWCYYDRLSALPLAANLPMGRHTVTVELLPEPPNRAEPIAEAKRLKRYDPNAFKGVSIRAGMIRILGPPQ